MTHHLSIFLLEKILRQDKNMQLVKAIFSLLRSKKGVKSMLHSFLWSKQYFLYYTSIDGVKSMLHSFLWSKQYFLYFRSIDGVKSMLHNFL